MTVITLTTDFGQADGYVGIMKGVILGIAPTAQFVDLSHDIAPQDVQRAALMIAQAAPYFPRGTIHLAVVDPGVGSERRALIVETLQACFVGPDNGIFTNVFDTAAVRSFVADRPEFWRPEVSHTFHGRDVFAPLAAHLARGVAADDLGTPIGDPVRLSHPLPERSAEGVINGQVTYADRFGNLITNVPGGWLGDRQWRCQVGGETILRLSPTYAAAASGTLLALVSSGGTLEIAVRDGSAALRLKATAGTPVILLPSRNASG